MTLSDQLPDGVLFAITLYEDGAVAVIAKDQKVDRVPDVLRILIDAIESGHLNLTINRPWYDEL